MMKMSPVLGPSGTLYFIQNRQVVVSDTNVSNPTPSRSDQPLPWDPTSNLCIDANQHLTLWATQTELAFDGSRIAGTSIPKMSPEMSDHNTQPFASAGVQNPKEALRWIIGPDGSRYAQNESYLFVLRPYWRDPLNIKDSNLTGSQQTFVTDHSILTPEGLVVPDKATVLFEFVKGFRVPRGQSLKIPRGASVTFRSLDGRSP